MIHVFHFFLNIFPNISKYFIKARAILGLNEQAAYFLLLCFQYFIRTA